MSYSPNVLLLSATIADVYITLYGLGVGCMETNPLVASLGWGPTLVGKLVATLFVAAALRANKDRLGGLAAAPGLVVTLFVLWNALNVSAQLW